MKVLFCLTLIMAMLYIQIFNSGRQNKNSKGKNACVRCIFGLRKYDHVSQGLKELRWLNMNNRARIHLLSFVHRAVTFEGRWALTGKIAFRDALHPRNLRYKYKLDIPRHSTQLFKRSFWYNAVTAYNQLPDDLKICKLNIFKNKVSSLLLESQ